MQIEAQECDYTYSDTAPKKEMHLPAVQILSNYNGMFEVFPLPILPRFGVTSLVIQKQSQGFVLVFGELCLFS